MDENALDSLFGDNEKKNTPILTTKNFTLSPNDIERVESCPASRVFVGPKEPPSFSMFYGIFVHRFLEYCNTRGRDEALAYLKHKSRNKRMIEMCEALPVHELPAHALVELSLGINIELGTADAVDHDSSDYRTHILMRADTIFDELDGKKLWHVADYKSGESGLDPETNVQLLTIATAVSMMHQLDAPVKGSIVDVNKNGFKWHTAVYSPKKINRHKKRLKLALYETLETRAEYHEEGVQPDIVPSPKNCYGCRAKMACPGAALAKKMK